MSLVPAAANDGPLFAEVDMGVDSSSAPTVRATVVQASTVFYDTPATLGLTFFHSQYFSLSIPVILMLGMYVLFVFLFTLKICLVT